MSEFRDMRTLYRETARAGIEWVLARGLYGEGFVDTKVDPLTLRAYGKGDGLCGPDFTYGWIQGRALEALVTHAQYFAASDADLSGAASETARGLQRAVAGLVARDGHAYFCYDAALTPVVARSDGPLHPQNDALEIYTFSDIFAAKGLAAAAGCFEPGAVARHVAYLLEAVAAVEDGRFQIDERQPLSHAAIARQDDDFGPRMILLGGADLLMRLGHADAAKFSERLIADVIDRHFDLGSGLLRNAPSSATSNVGHAIEFAGFALACVPDDCDPGLIATLERILSASFASGFLGYGLALGVDVASQRPTGEVAPWWSLPETIRAAAHCHRRTKSAQSRDIWRAAHRAFFTHFWRGTPPIAYQMRTAAGPIHRAPATPDLDPGYHTGLSLLAAADIIDRDFGD